MGVVGFKLLESFNLCLKTEGEHLYFSKNKQIFPTLFKLVQKYPLNNIFHNEVFRFMTTCLSSAVTELAQSVSHEIFR